MRRRLGNVPEVLLVRDPIDATKSWVLKSIADSGGTVPEHIDLEYRRLIQSRSKQVGKFYRYWSRRIASRREPPLVIGYPDLRANTEHVMTNVLAHLGIGSDSAAVNSVVRQSTKEKTIEALGVPAGHPNCWTRVVPDHVKPSWSASAIELIQRNLRLTEADLSLLPKGS